VRLPFGIALTDPEAAAPCDAVALGIGRAFLEHAPVNHDGQAEFLPDIALREDEENTTLVLDEVHVVKADAVDAVFSGFAILARFAGVTILADNRAKIAG